MQFEDRPHWFDRGEFMALANLPALAAVSPGLRCLWSWGFPSCVGCVPFPRLPSEPALKTVTLFARAAFVFMVRIIFDLLSQFSLATELQVHISHVNQGGHLDNAQFLSLVSEAWIRFSVRWTVPRLMSRACPPWWATWSHSASAGLKGDLPGPAGRARCAR